MGGSSGPGPLGEFLAARRARRDPHDVGVAELGPRRRVAGLRREELAQLAGVSVSYYTRLEQGLSRGASPEVLEAIGRVLDLDEHEREHLDRLADTSRRSPGPRRPRPERVSDETRELLAALGDVPAVVLGRRTDVLAWNPMGHALIGGHLDPAGPDDPGRRPNTTRMLFLDPDQRELHVDWERKARSVVANLRVVAGRHPEDPVLAALVGELTMASREFVALWADHRARPCSTTRHALHHPLVGALTVTQQPLAITRSPEQTLVLSTAPDASSQEALALLRHVVGGGRPGRSQPRGASTGSGPVMSS